MKKHISIAALSAVLVLASCGNPKQVAYFQDIQDGSENVLASPDIIRIRPDDKLSIVVNARDPQLANLFNLAYTSRMLGTDQIAGYNGTSQGISGYSVDSKGEIDFPVVGKIRVAGLTRQEIAMHIKRILEERKLVADPVITVEYLNLKVSVMGEVSHPGRFAIDHDSYTVLDAISAAGDLTIFGQRSNVKVLRTVNGVKKTYQIDLCSADNLMRSPVYYLQQNDIVYVEPNKVRARQSTVNGNNILSTSFWISIASLAVTVLLAVKQFTK